MRLTRAFKEAVCQICRWCEQEDLKIPHRNHCEKEFAPYKSGCRNYRDITETEPTEDNNVEQD